MLSHDLAEAGFCLALGDTEYGADRETRVECGSPYTCDGNNGVSVVYDERGRPWVANGGFAAVGRLCDRHPSLKRGAYVPHSSDGGLFVRRLKKIS